MFGDMPNPSATSQPLNEPARPANEHPWFCSVGISAIKRSVKPSKVSEGCCSYVANIQKHEDCLITAVAIWPPKGPMLKNFHVMTFRALDAQVDAGLNLNEQSAIVAVLLTINGACTGLG